VILVKVFFQLLVEWDSAPVCVQHGMIIGRRIALAKGGTDGLLSEASFLLFDLEVPTTLLLHLLLELLRPGVRVLFLNYYSGTGGLELTILEAVRVLQVALVLPFLLVKS
jgi:hypothetical protein